MKKYNDTEQEAVKKTWAGEKAKLSQMSFGEKLEYIWAYYKLHILAILLILGAITWGVHHAMTYVEYRIYGMVINSGQFNEELNDTLHDTLKMAKHDGVNITADLYTDESANMGGYGNRLDIYVMSGQLDFAFTDQAGVDYLVDGKTYSGYVAVDISDSKIHEYFGLADNINYLVIADLSGSEEYMDNFYKLLYEIEGE